MSQATVRINTYKCISFWKKLHSDYCALL